MNTAKLLFLIAALSCAAATSLSAQQIEGEYAVLTMNGQPVNPNVDIIATIDPNDVTGFFDINLYAETPDVSQHIVGESGEVFPTMDPNVYYWSNNQGGAGTFTWNPDTFEWVSEVLLSANPANIGRKTIFRRIRR